MNLKTTALAVMLAAASIAHAAPTMQTCAPMNISHNGDAGLSYLLTCDAGEWSLKYSGAVPAGTESVVARYRLQASKASGESFSHNRTVRLPAPNLLGQALVREAVSLDNGDLALRECEEFNCTLYRPLGGVAKLAKATVTMPPELKRVSDEAARLNAEVAKSRVAATEQSAIVAGLRQEIHTLTQQLALAKEQANTASADQSAASSATVELKEKLESVTADLLAARQELKECAAEHEALKRAHDAQVNSLPASSNDAVNEQAKKVAALEQAHARINAELLNEQEGKKAAQAELEASQQKIQELATALQTARRTIDDMVTEQANQVDELQAALMDVKGQLAAAKQVEQVSQAVKVELTDAAQRNDKQALQLKQMSDALAAANSNAAAQEDAFVTLKKAYEQNLKQLAELHVGGRSPSEPAMDSVVAERDAARAEVERLKAELDVLEPQIAMLDTARIDALKSAQQMAKNTLQALDQIQELQEAKADAEKTIASSTSKLMEAAAKVEASNMARDLAMQAVAAAHADADALNLKNQELQAQLAEQAKELASLRQKLAENSSKLETLQSKGASD